MVFQCLFYFQCPWKFYTLDTITEVSRSRHHSKFEKLHWKFAACIWWFWEQSFLWSSFLTDASLQQEGGPSMCGTGKQLCQLKVENTARKDSRRFKCYYSWASNWAYSFPRAFSLSPGVICHLSVLPPAVVNVKLNHVDVMSGGMGCCWAG